MKKAKGKKKKQKKRENLQFEKRTLSKYEHCFRIDSPMYDFIDTCLRHKNEMVIYEAASTIVSLKCVTPKELSSAVNVLQLFISSPKPVSRYAAVRTLNKVRFLFDFVKNEKLFVFLS